MEIVKTIERFIVDDLIVGNKDTTIDPNESLINQGIIDSLALLRLISFIEDQFGVKVEDTEMIPENFQTINDMRSFIEMKLNP